MLIDKTELSKGLALATAGLRDGEVFELRVLPSGHSGTFRSAKEARAALSKLATQLGAWDGAYFMPNPMKGEPTNALKTGKAGRDVDVTRRRWLLLDVDPERPKVAFPGGGEGKASATDREKAHAWELRQRIVADLREVYGFADPVMSDSGNGYHAMWAVDLPADSDVPERFLATLARVYDTGEAKVDRSVKNAARIWKLPGTLACKGPNLAPERPWRMAKAETLPEKLYEVVPEAMSLMLESLEAAPEPAPVHRSSTASATFSEARESYKRERTPAWPVKVGTCPVCGHNGCFRALPGGGKWFCFSSGHAGAGRYTGRGWMGDVIDIDCHTSGKTERELLLSAGYLKDRPMKRERGGQEPPTWASEAIPDGGPVTPLPKAAAPKPEIRVRPGDLDGMMAESAASLARDEFIYTRSGELVEACVTPDGFQLVSLVKATLRGVMERNATWIQMVKRTDKEGNVSMVEAVANVNDRVVEGLLKAPRLWSQLRHVQNIHGLPVVRMDGSLAAEGYDPVTKLLIRYDGVKFGEIGTTRAQAEAALTALLDLFAEFPFESERDRSVAVCLCVMACVRRVLPLAPGVLLDSPSSGIGKGLLINMASLIATGKDVAPQPQPKDEDELTKFLFSTLKEGTHHIAFDNVSGQFGGEAYDMLMTSGVFKGRVLGQSVVQAVPASALVTISGRNVAFRGDAAGRTLRCKLVTPLERPDEGRTFKYQPLERHVMKHRGEIVAQVLTIVRAYLLAGRPCEMRPLRMYYEWGAMAREPLVWLGMVDPVESITKQRIESDSDLAAYGELTHAMYEAFGDRAMTMAKLVREAVAQGPWFEKRERLREAIQEVAGVEPTSARCSAALGYKLRKNAGRPVDGLVLDRAGKGEGNASRSAGGVIFEVRVVGNGPTHTKPPSAASVVNLVPAKAEGGSGW
jgi:putative DNA primase/helicase